MKMMLMMLSRLLPSITGGKMLGYGLTSFDHVQLPATALLGDLARTLNMRDQYLSAINHLGTGALAPTLWVILFLKAAVLITGRYSQGQTVQQGTHGERSPIIAFRNQQLPILHTIAQIAIMEPFSN
jgi:hypothetical protein